MVLHSHDDNRINELAPRFPVTPLSPESLTKRAGWCSRAFDIINPAQRERPRQKILDFPFLRSIYVSRQVGMLFSYLDVPAFLIRPRSAVHNPVLSLEFVPILRLSEVARYFCHYTIFLTLTPSSCKILALKKGKGRSCACGSPPTADQCLITQTNL